jgi:acetolactate synthase-1/2/3 large subunit
MNGAQSLSKTLFGGGINTCFINPGTTELHLVTAMTEEPGMKVVLCLFEGVCTGAADGYARMTGKPASTILHLGPGLANGLANLHNAKRALSPVVVIIGDHATYHGQYDAPLASDIASLANPVSGWLRSCANALSLAQDGAEAVEASLKLPGQVATIIVPADCAWSKAKGPAVVEPAEEQKTAPEKNILQAVAALQTGQRAVMLLGNQALQEDCLNIIGRIVKATGVSVMFETFSARLQRGAGRFPVKRLPYFPEKVLEALAGTAHVILVGAKPPVSFFAYEDKPSWLVPEDCQICTLANPNENVLEALEALAREVGASNMAGQMAPLSRPSLPTGNLTAKSVGETLGALLPENAIVSDESVTSGGPAFDLTTTAPPHDWLFLTGGSMGQGLPVATGAALACTDRKVICLHGDGGAMYTLQALWTQAREALDITTIIYSNRKYNILRNELTRAGLENVGSKILRLFDLSDPGLDWVKLATGMGVYAYRAETAEEFNQRFGAAMAEPGPCLIEAVI